ncbi:MAG: chorismate mutase [Oscillospiraceae bacterium]|nr:chorismate mutase [Oscillospiraceae bacterium]
MSLENLRGQIDAVDTELLSLFERRMELSRQIAEVKSTQGLPISDPVRESEKMLAVSGRVQPALTYHAHTLYDTLFELSKSYQRAASPLPPLMLGEIRGAVRDCFPTSATVACPGVEGSFSQLACERLFAYPNLVHFKSSTFDKVFAAIENGLCDYGVLPLENSTTGLVGKIYDLMKNNYSNFRIVKSVRLGVEHNLLAPPGVKLEDVREIFSHEQALRQCAGFIDSLGTPGVEIKITPCENTAIAAESVAGSDRKDIAAIGSHRCIELYGLNCLAKNIQDEAANYTRFICISKQLEIYPGANRSSIIMVTPNTPGSLSKALRRFYALGLNLIKLESRPLFENNSAKVMFYLDFECSPHSEAFARLLDEMKVFCEEFQYLGSYTEVV